MNNRGNGADFKKIATAPVAQILLFPSLRRQMIPSPFDDFLLITRLEGFTSWIRSCGAVCESRGIHQKRKAKADHKLREVHS